MKVGDQYEVNCAIRLLIDDSKGSGHVQLWTGDRIEVVAFVKSGTYSSNYYPAARLKIIATGRTCLAYTATPNWLERDGILRPVHPLILLAECSEDLSTSQET